MPPKGAKKAGPWGEWARQVRLAQPRMTQKDFGKKIGLSRGAVANYERGDNEPSGETVIRIAAEFPNAPPVPVLRSNGQSSTVVLPNGHKPGGYVTLKKWTTMVVMRLEELPDAIQYEAALAALNAIEKVVKDPHETAADPSESPRDRHS